MTDPKPRRASVASLSERTPWRAAAKPDNLSRFLAALIDGLIAVGLGYLPYVGGLVGAAYILFRDGLDLPFMDRRSIGKRLLGLRPARLDGKAMTPLASAKRNWTLVPALLTQTVSRLPVLNVVLFPPVALFATVLLVAETMRFLNEPDGRRWGDRLAETRVVQADGARR